MQIMKEGTIDRFIICCGIFRQTMQEVIDYKKKHLFTCMRTKLFVCGISPSLISLIVLLWA